MLIAILNQIAFGIIPKLLAVGMDVAPMVKYVYDTVKAEGAPNDAAWAKLNAFCDEWEAKLQEAAKDTPEEAVTRSSSRRSSSKSS